VTARWYVYVAAFLLGVALVVIGTVRGDTTLVFAGVIIGAILFITRNKIQ
jgi:hypothetical protein